MTKYLIEGNINFKEELNKLLNSESNEIDESNLCNISGEKLTNYHISLECGHKFNYIPLFNEIYKQKFIFKYYNDNLLNYEQLCKYKEHNYFIKCPYCRNIQFTILPYYEELNFPKAYGINSTDKTLKNQQVLSVTNTKTKMKDDILVIFHTGKCCYNRHVPCKSQTVASIKDTNLEYCINH